MVRRKDEMVSVSWSGMCDEYRVKMDGVVERCTEL